MVGAGPGSLDRGGWALADFDRFPGVSPSGGGTEISISVRYQRVFNGARTFHSPLGSHSETRDQHFIIVRLVDVHGVLNGAPWWKGLRLARFFLDRCRGWRSRGGWSGCLPWGLGLGFRFVSFLRSGASLTSKPKPPQLIKQSHLDLYRWCNLFCHGDRD